jgi:hypothetical protein
MCASLMFSWCCSEHTKQAPAIQATAVHLEHQIAADHVKHELAHRETEAELVHRGVLHAGEYFFGGDRRQRLSLRGGSLVRWFVGSLVRWFVGSLVGWFVGSLVGWFVGWLVVGWLIGWLAGLAGVA